MALCSYVVALWRTHSVLSQEEQRRTRSDCQEKEAGSLPRTGSQADIHAETGMGQAEPPAGGSSSIAGEGGYWLHAGGGSSA